MLAVEMSPKPIHHVLTLGVEHMTSCAMEQTAVYTVALNHTARAVFLFIYGNLVTLILQHVGYG